jgi:hypothetical protein
MTVTSLTMMGQNGVSDATTAPPLLRDNNDDDGQEGCLFGLATFLNAKGRGGDCDDNKTLCQPTHMFAAATNDRFLLASIRSITMSLTTLILCQIVLKYMF